MKESFPFQITIRYLYTYLFICGSHASHFPIHIYLLVLCNYATSPRPETVINCAHAQLLLFLTTDCAAYLFSKVASPSLPLCFSFYIYMNERLKDVSREVINHYRFSTILVIFVLSFFVARSTSQVLYFCLR